jgi:hypothetical protein
LRPIKDLYTNISPILRDQLQNYLAALNEYAVACETAAYLVGWYCRIQAENGNGSAQIKTRQRVARRQAQGRALRLSER